MVVVSQDRFHCIRIVLYTPTILTITWANYDYSGSRLQTPLLPNNLVNIREVYSGQREYQIY